MFTFFHQKDSFVFVKQVWQILFRVLFERFLLDLLERHDAFHISKMSTLVPEKKHHLTIAHYALSHFLRYIGFPWNDSTSHKTVLLLDIIIYIGDNAKIWCSHTFRLNEVPFLWATVRVCHSDIQHYVNLTDILSSNQNHQVQFVWFHLSLYSLQIICLISKWNLLISCSPRLFHQISIGLSNTYCLHLLTQRAYCHVIDP